eukprot:111604-Alexandrium_andersonii.AAC.1
MLPRCFVADAELRKKLVSRPTDALCHIIDRAGFPAGNGWELRKAPAAAAAGTPPEEYTQGYLRVPASALGRLLRASGNGVGCAIFAARSRREAPELLPTVRRPRQQAWALRGG